MSITEQRMRQQVRERLAELLGTGDMVAQSKTAAHKGADFVVKADHLTFVIECQVNGAPARIAEAAATAQRRALQVGSKAIPLVAAPFMGPAGRVRCQQLGVGWLDLSGNAHIKAPGVHVHVDGKPNRFKAVGRPASVFAPKSSRIARQLLLDPAHAFAQRELAQKAGIDEGLTSRIVHRMEHDGLVTRSDGKISVPKAAILLDAWHEAYQFDKHEIVRGHIASRTGDDLLGQIAAVLGKAGVEYAATGLAGAWLLTHFAAFRLATIFLPAGLTADLRERLSFREDERGANTWFVIPNDAGVFAGKKKIDGVWCADPVQVYLDLKAQPERATEAADRLRKDLLQFGEK